MWDIASVWHNTATGMYPTLHVLLSDDAPNHNGAYFSQQSVLYRGRERRAGGWPMESPNPNAKVMDTAHRLIDMNYDIVGLLKP